MYNKPKGNKINSLKFSNQTLNMQLWIQSILSMHLFVHYFTINQKLKLTIYIYIYIDINAKEPQVRISKISNCLF